MCRNTLENDIDSASLRTLIEKTLSAEYFELSKILDWRNVDAQRYYSLLLGKDLFGQIVLVRSWGSNKTQQSGEKREVIPTGSISEIDSKIRVIINTRARHGYSLNYMMN